MAADGEDRERGGCELLRFDAAALPAVLAGDAVGARVPVIALAVLVRPASRHAPVVDSVMLCFQAVKS
jgi:hypothetical protein